MIDTEAFRKMVDKHIEENKEEYKRLLKEYGDQPKTEKDFMLTGKMRKRLGNYNE